MQHQQQRGGHESQTSIQAPLARQLLPGHSTRRSCSGSSSSITTRRSNISSTSTHFWISARSRASLSFGTSFSGSTAATGPLRISSSFCLGSFTGCKSFAIRPSSSKVGGIVARRVFRKRICEASERLLPFLVVAKSTPKSPSSEPPDPPDMFARTRVKQLCTQRVKGEDHTPAPQLKRGKARF